MRVLGRAESPRRWGGKGAGPASPAFREFFWESRLTTTRGPMKVRRYQVEKTSAVTRACLDSDDVNMLRWIAIRMLAIRIGLVFAALAYWWPLLVSYPMPVYYEWLTIMDKLPL